MLDNLSKLAKNICCVLYKYDRSLYEAGISVACFCVNTEHHAES